MRRVIVGSVVVASLLAAEAFAGTTVVNPGPGTPLQDAIDAASPGGKLKVKSGSYPEAITIAKALRIEGDKSFTIDAGCGTPAAVTITGDDVELRGASVRGGATDGVLVSAADHVTLNRVTALPSCPGVRNGIHADGTTRLLVKDSSTYAWDVAAGQASSCHSPLQQGEREFTFGISVEDTPAGAGNRILHNTVCNATTAIFAHGALPSPFGPEAVKIQRNQVVYASFEGIILGDAQHVLITGNRISAALGGAQSGLALAGTAEDNVVKQNRVSGFEVDVFDSGLDNCWKANKFVTGEQPTDGCP